MKKVLLSAIALTGIIATSNAQINTGDILNKAKDKITGGSTSFSNADIGAALKEALNKGVSEQVTKLTAVDGFYKNEAVKILLPDELQKVDKKLRQVGMGKLADEGLLVLNRAAEDAVKEATPIFVNAITSMTITDAKNILMGSDNSATTYLQKTTTTPLYGKFNPVVKTSLSNVGADAVWEKIITKYNSLPLVTKVNPDLTDYVTNRALDGVFKMIAVEEKNIRTNLSSRTSDLLKKVFALQD
ncbi:hypothetical protein AM493_07470 [Flavobacterium akiainvivens]|uniref:DUF4197 domain-containing protein n=1 Tax=Flavobacterium akiainvivens TaxID=1202724 RepID=A0A0M9VHT3_9FLAO|nr:DUF4197 domain-containing protein [Flavobacterium akiainvivens]KOS05892.1 hypothetical protein AM493_07470 [Flavobacterium akiainvivens]SFQ56169.1 Protein of unknown function [Flavobacterium akiainvivens]